MNIEELKNFRRTLHKYPELAWHEAETSKRVKEFLKVCNYDSIIEGVAGNGIVATWDSGIPGKEILLRADMDALPIKEKNDFSYRSVNDGVSHKCGHDGHTAILCGVARNLAKNPPDRGKVRLLFQPAEESGEGAEAMLNDDRMKDINPDFVFALHNIPAYPLKSIIVKEGSFSAAVNSVIIYLTGKTSHAAEPENGINPALAVAQILNDSLKLENNDPDDDNMKIVTPVYVLLGEKAYGTSAGEAEVHFTIRCWNDKNLLELQNEIEELSKEIAEKHGIEISFSYTQTFYANNNDSECVEYLRIAADKIDASIIEKGFPFKWGEDFGFFTSRFKGCMFGLGSGERSPALHNPDYDFPDEIIETGVKLFCELINTIQEKNV